MSLRYSPEQRSSILSLSQKALLGEQHTNLVQRLLLNPSDYHVFNNIRLDAPWGISQLDHVIISRFGIFVIESKWRNGWVFGDADDMKWTIVLYRKKYSFQNPIRQNSGHIDAIAKYLKVNPNTIHSLIVFWGDASFKTRMPKNVLKGDCFIGYVKSKTRVLLTQDEVYRIRTLMRLAKVRQSSDSYCGKNTVATEANRDTNPLSPSQVTIDE
jgi:hypothetical protein